MHRLVLVAGADWEESLLPYAQAEAIEPPSPHLEFVDTEAEGRSRYETGTLGALRMPDGRSVPLLSDETLPFRRKLTKAERAVDRARLEEKHLFVFGAGDDMLVVEPPRGGALCKVPFREAYRTFEEFMDHLGEPPEDGRYGYWHNPSGVWDWYAPGGRWRGFLLTKPGRTGRIARPGGIELDPAPVSGRVDQAAKGDVDFEAMEEAARQDALTFWDQAFGPLPPAMFDGADGGHLARTLAGFRTGHRPQRDMQDYPFATAGLRGEGPPIPFDAAGDAVLMGRARYAEQAALRAWVPAALLLDGEWHELGGGAAGQEHPDWVAHARQLVAALPDDTLLTAVDCHS